jgi:hypothetical protein
MPPPAHTVFSLLKSIFSTVSSDAADSAVSPVGAWFAFPPQAAIEHVSAVMSMSFRNVFILLPPHMIFLFHFL